MAKESLAALNFGGLNLDKLKMWWPRDGVEPPTPAFSRLVYVVV
jgi:hypothetical protein